MELFEENLMDKVDDICAIISGMDEDAKIQTLNAVRARLHEVSPFKDQPVDLVQWVPTKAVKANDYNPNTVAPPEMKLLRRSISKDGYTQPVVAHDLGNDKFEVVDGFHRTRCAKEYPEIKKRLRGYVPVTKIKSNRKDINARMEATIRHNRARGVHGVSPMTDIVAEMLRNGASDEDVAKELGMDADELLRFKQNSGLPELFKDCEYSKSWEVGK